MTAIWSFIVSRRARLPEVVAIAAGLVQATERQLDVGADLHLALRGVGHLEVEAPAALHVDDRHRHRMLRDGREVVDREREHGAALPELLLRHAVARTALEADARLRELHETARVAPAAVEPDVLADLLPRDHRRHGFAYRLRGKDAARAQVALVRRQDEAAREAVGDRPRARRREAVRRAEDEGVGAFAPAGDDDEVARGRGLEAP